MRSRNEAERKNEREIYALAEQDANLFNLKVMGVLAAMSALSLILNFLGVFSVEIEVMLISMLFSIFLFCMPICVYLVRDKLSKRESRVIESEWFRNMIITCVFVGIGFICVALSFHATILLAIPPLMAAQYRYDRKTFFYVFVATMLLVPLSIYGGFFFGSPDKNLLKGLTPEEMKVFAERLRVATPKRMLELFTHYTLPLLLGVVAIVVIVTGITRRNRKMTEKHIELSVKVREEMEARAQMQEKIIEILASLIETRDLNTGEHVIRTKKLVGMIAREMQKEEKYREILTDDAIERMENAAPLHDVGKIIVSDTILLKPGKLTNEEFDKMKTHASAGGALIDRLFKDLNDAAFLQTAKDIAVSHHERWDGTGYPEGLKKETIPLCARIMAVADVYDALISKRVYKGAIAPEEALGIIFSESGTHFDPDIMRVVENMKDKLVSVAGNAEEDQITH